MKFAYNRLMQYEYVFHEAWDMIVLLLTYYHVFYSPFYSFFDHSWSIRIQRLKKAAHVEHFFYFIYFHYTKTKNWKRKGKKHFIKNVHIMEAIQWTFIVYSKLFTAFFYYLSRKFSFTWNCQYYFLADRKTSNLSWWTLTIRSASPQTGR